MIGLLIAKQDQKQTMRAVKTAFFLISMLISFLLLSAPVLLAIADALLPAAILSASLHLSDYDFTLSLFDIPILSLARSAIIICKPPLSLSLSKPLFLFRSID